MSIVSRMFKRISKIYFKKLQTIIKIAKISSFQIVSSWEKCRRKLRF